MFLIQQRKKKRLLLLLQLHLSQRLRRSQQINQRLLLDLHPRQPRLQLHLKLPLLLLRLLLPLRLLLLPKQEPRPQLLHLKEAVPKLLRLPRRLQPKLVLPSLLLPSLLLRELLLKVLLLRLELKQKSPLLLQKELQRVIRNLLLRQQQRHQPKQDLRLLPSQQQRLHLKELLNLLV